MTSRPAPRNSLTETKGHPWKDTLRKLDDEWHSSVSPLTSPQNPQAHAYVDPAAQSSLPHHSGQNVRSVDDNDTNYTPSKRGHRVGIFPSGSMPSNDISGTSGKGAETNQTEAPANMESNLESLELALQDTSKEESTASTAETHPSPMSSSPKRSPQSLIDSDEDEGRNQLQRHHHYHHPQHHYTHPPTQRHPDHSYSHNRAGNQAGNVDPELAYIHQTNNNNSNNQQDEISAELLQHYHRQRQQYRHNSNDRSVDVQPRIYYDKPPRQPKPKKGDPTHPDAYDMQNAYAYPTKNNHGAHARNSTNPFDAYDSESPVDHPPIRRTNNTNFEEEDAFEDEYNPHHNKPRNIRRQPHPTSYQYNYDEVASQSPNLSDPLSKDSSSMNPYSHQHPHSYIDPSNSSSSGENRRGGHIPPISSTIKRKTRTNDSRQPTMASNNRHQNHYPANNSKNYRMNSTNSVSSSTGISIDSDDPRLQERLGLHMLCAEAKEPHDIAWRNALYLLGLQPQLAKELDDQGRTPLHIACMGQPPPHQQGGGEQGQDYAGESEQRQPPDFMTQALLVAHPGAVQQTDQDGRLPLHCLVASSGCIETMQLLVEAHPTSITARDAMGFTPLHLLLQNETVLITVAQVQILLGMTLPLQSQNQQQHQQSSQRVLQRRGNHLRLRVEHLDRMLEGEGNARHPPVWRPIQRYDIAPEVFDSYPEDVQVCLRRLVQWERKEHRLQEQSERKGEQKAQKHEEEKKDSGDQSEKHNENNRSLSKQNQSKLDEDRRQSLSSFGLDSLVETDTNSAAIKLPQDRRLPLHMIIFRGMLDMGLQRSRASVETTDPQRRCFGGWRHDGQHQHHRQQHQQDQEQRTLVVIARLLISAFPEGLISRDNNGHTPLMLAMLASTEILPSQELLELLLGKRTAGFESLPSWAEDAPYPAQHMYLPNSRQGLSPAAERYCNPAMVGTLDTCQLPLHVAAEDWGDHPSLLVAVYDSYPGAINVQDARGRMPLHILLENYRRVNPHPQIVALLLSERVAKTQTDEGNLPFDLLVACCRYLPRDPVPCNEAISPNGVVAHPDPYKAFQQFFQASILRSSRSRRGEPNSSPESNILQRRAEANVFLCQLKKLPPWLRRQGCSAPFVQELLVEELSSPTKCAFIMLYGLLLVLLLAAFRQQMEYFTETAAPFDIVLPLSFNITGLESISDGLSERYEGWTISAVYAFSAGSIGFQAVFVALSCSLNEFQHLWLFNIWRWIDFMAVTMAILTTVLVQESFPDDYVFIVGTAATGLLWCSLVGYFANFWYGTAFFTGALMKIARMVMMPLFVAGIFLVGFAEMFYTLSQVDCTQIFASTPVCSLQDVYQLVYFILMGEPFFELGGKVTMSPGMIALVALFTLLAFLLCLCLLVVVVVVASKYDEESVALDAYWEPKLAMVLSSQTTRDAASLRSTGKPTPMPTCMDRVVNRLAKLWDVLTASISCGKKHNHWYIVSSSPWKDGGLKVLALLLTPLWIVAGLLTLGILWPPQIRTIIFRPRRDMQHLKPNEAREFFTSQVAGVRNDIMKMRDMSYEQSNEIQKDIKELKALIAASIKGKLQ